MKKWYAIICFVIILGCFCSCGGQILVQSLVITPPNMASAEMADNYNMSLITSSTGLITNDIASGDNSFYTLRGYVDASADIIKYDLDTMQIEKFTSTVIPDLLGGGIVATAGNNFLVFKLGHVPFSDIYEGMSSKLYILNQSGVIQNTITLPPQQLFKANSAVAYDGQNTIFVVISTYQDGEDHPVCTQENVYTINLATGTITALQSLATSSSTIISNVYPDGLVMTTINNAATRTAHSNLSQTLLPIYGISQFSSDSESNSLEVLSGASTYVSDGNGKFYFINKNDTSLMCYEASTGDISNIVSNLNVINDPQYIPYIVGEIYNNHLVISLDNGFESIDLYVDLGSKSIVDSPMPLTEDFASQGDIVYEGEDYLIVRTGIEYIETTQYGGGNAYTFDECVPQFQAVPKAQFWLRSANYLEFTDLVYSSN